MDREKTLIITDLDGTFVHDSYSVKLKDQAAFSSLQDIALVGIATGRSFKEIGYIEKNFNITADVKVAFNGAMIQDQNEQMLKDNPIDQNNLEQLWLFLEKHSLTFDALNGVERIGNYYTNDKERLWDMDLICLSSPINRLRQEKIYKINIRPKYEEFQNYYDLVQKEFPTLGVYESGHKRIEVTAANTSKGDAVQALREKGGRQIVSVGDSGNDVPMFKNSDLSFCMRTAPENVKTQADIIIDSFADIEKYTCKFLSERQEA